MGGVERLVVIDPDRVERSNLPRLPILSDANVGAYKALALAKALKAGGRMFDVRIATLTTWSADRLLAGTDVV